MQFSLSQFCDHNQLFFVVLYFQAININPYYLLFHLLAAGSFTDNRFQEHFFLTEHIDKRLSFLVFIIQSEEKQRNSIGILTNIKIIIF